jgi:hypothetical protein
MALIPSTTKKGMGFKKDDPDPRDRDFDKLGLMSSGMPSLFTLRRHTPDALNQGATSSCVAHAFACALFILETIAGTNPQLASRLFLYWFSRFQHKGQFLDSGTYLRSMAEALRRFGVPDEEFWRFGQFTTTINKRPSVEAMGKGHARHGGKYVRIFDQGDARTLAIKAAIVNRLPVCFGTALAKSYFANEGPMVVEYPDFSVDKSVGNHAQCIIGFDDTLVQGQTAFELQNSWGGKWRAGGRVFVTQEYIESQRSSDFQIVYGWKALQVAA